MKALRRSFLLFTLFAAAVYRLPACGPGPFEGEAAFLGIDRLACFSWSQTDDPLYRDLLPASNDQALWYDGRYKESAAEVESFSREWAVYLGLNPALERDLAGVREMLNADDPAGYFRQTMKAVATSPTNSPRSAAIQSYLTFMGQAAAYDQEAQPWQPEVPGPSLAQRWKTLYEASNKVLAKGGLDSFLTQRYAYLTLRAAVHNKLPQRALDIYQSSFASKPNSLLRFKAWSYAAKAAVDLGDRTKALQWYLSIFDQTADLQFAMIDSLDALDLDDQAWEALIGTLPAGHRRAVAAFVRALMDPHVETTRYMERIDSEEPGSTGLVKLLIRALRAIDADRLPRLLAGYAAPGKELVAAPKPGYGDLVPAEIDTAKIESLLSFTRAVISKGKEWNPGLWRAAEAHLELVLGKPDAAAMTLEASRPAENGFSPSAKRALAIQRILVAVARGASPADIQKLLPDALSAVDALAKDGDTAPRATVFSTLGLGRLSQGDFPRAVLDFTTAGYEQTVKFLLDVYAGPDDLVAITRLLSSPPDFESATGAGRFTFKASAINYIRGVRLMRSESYAEAARVFSSLPASFWTANPVQKPMYGFDESYLETPMFFVKADFTNTLDPEVQGQVLRKDALNKKLADLEHAGDDATMGWIYLSTPFVGYDDLIWNGEMVDVLSRVRFDQWPLMTKELSAAMQERYSRFLNEYDSHSIAARHLKEALLSEKDLEKGAPLALGLLSAVSETPYTGSIGTPSNPPVAKDTDVASVITDIFGKTRAVAKYRNGFEDGCPGLASSR